MKVLSKLPLMLCLASTPAFSNTQSPDILKDPVNTTTTVTQAQANQIAQKGCKDSGYSFEGNAEIELGYDNVLLEPNGITNVRFSCVFPGSENKYKYEPANNKEGLKELCEFAQDDWSIGVDGNPVDTICYNVNTKALREITQQ